MDIGLGLGLAGSIMNKPIKKDIDINDRIENIPQYCDNIYSDTQIFNNREKVYKQFNKNFSESLKKDSNIINDNWRIQNDESMNKINKNKVKSYIDKDLKNLKNLKYTNNNIIEKMSNMNYNDNDSTFTNDDGLSKFYKDSDNDNNINTKVLNIREKFMDDVISDYAANSDDDKSYCNEFQKQFEPLEFKHRGLPNTFNNMKTTVKLFNNKPVIDGKFNPNDDGRYGVTSDMNHENMQPNFKSKEKGYNPMMNKQWNDMSSRKVELYTGSDQNPQFKHKAEVKPLFNPVTNKVDSVTGTPVFTDFYESRYIPSDKRQSEKPFQPIRVSPGLNLGYNQSGATGKQDLYRSLPKTIDELRPLTNPKVSYKNQIIPGQKGNNRGIVGETVQYTPDRFFYNTKDSLLPTNGDFVAPAIYGKYLAPQTNRSIAEQTTHLNPISNKQNNTPEYLQGLHKKPFKKSFKDDGPRNVTYDTKGQNINRNFIIDETNRNMSASVIGTAKGNKYETFLTNYDNAIPEATIREQTGEIKNLNNTKGNYSEVPLINFMNMIPDVTKRQILLEDNGKNNLTNVSNSIKGYLFNSINSIPDETLRSILTEKIILTNTTGNKTNGYLFNKENGVSDTNMRNLSENNLILTTLSNKQQSYLFNNINSIPDPTLRDIVNSLWKSGGANFKGNHSNDYLFNYENSVPDTTLRELTQDIIKLTNFTGPSGQIKGYLYNYINSVPDTTLKELTEDKIILNSIKPIQLKDYLFNYINSIPESTLRELSENTVYINNQKGNNTKNYMYNYDNNIPDTTLREMIGDIIKIGNFNGNHRTGYLINYINSIPDTTMKEMTENNTNILNMNPIKVKGYLLNYLNSIPDTTIKEFTEDVRHITNPKGNYNQQYQFNFKNAIPDSTQRENYEDTKNITGTKGNFNSDFMFNYDAAIPDSTQRENYEETKNITGTRGNFNSDFMFNYDAGIPDHTNRDQTTTTKNITGTKGNYDGKYIFNYDAGIPDHTNRDQTTITKNITGTRGNADQNRSRLDYNNALLNVEKEVIAQGRSPVPVKNNKGPTAVFTQYVFCNDNSSEMPIFSGVKPNVTVKNEYYFG